MIRERPALTGIFSGRPAQVDQDAITRSMNSTPKASASLAANAGVPLAARPRKTAELLAQRIVAEIIDSGAEPGTMLPPEKAMLVNYEVSRGTLREALRFLEMQGVLKIRTGPGGGPSIGQIDSRPLASNLALMLAMDRTPFRAILEVRQTLEPTLAAKSATQMDEAGLGELEESITALEREIKGGDQQAVVYANRRFHDVIAIEAGNQVFARLVMALNWIIDGSPLGVHFPSNQIRGAVKAHRSIYDAIASHDPDRAHSAMEAHLEEFTGFLETRYGDTLNRPLRWDSENY